MQYGYFDDENREYVITTPQTPWPWINYLGTQDFFSLISNTAGGYCFYKDARFRRILRYRYNNVPRDTGGRYYYIREGDHIWSPGWKPVKSTLTQYKCRHGLGYTAIQGARNDLSCEILFFVPLNENVEVHRITLRNESKKKKSFSLFSFVEFAFWNALDDMTNFQRNFNIAEMEVKDSVIFHKTEYRERRNHFAFYSVNHPIDGFDTDRDIFVGVENGLEMPLAVTNDLCKNSIADSWAAIGSHHLRLTLEPGEAKELIFLLGYGENPQNKKWESPGVLNKTTVEKVIQKYSSTAKVEESMRQLRAYWGNLLSNYQLSHSDKKLSRMVNQWNPYQCMITFNLSRSTSYFESGIGRGMGFRDSNQDLLGFVHMVPQRSKERILDLAATQFEDGGAFHQYQPLTKRGNHEVGGNFNDDPLWLIASVAAYVKETGDKSILKKQVPFENNEKKKGSLFEHCKRSFYHVVKNLGPHGLPLIGRADWNDCLNLNAHNMNPDLPYQTCPQKYDGKKAESVLIAGMFVYYGSDFIKLCKIFKKEKEAKKAEKYIDEMILAVEKHGWDGEWFLRAYDAKGKKIGSHENQEGKIFIESQGFCSMAQIGQESGKVQKALDSVSKYLDTPHGIVLQNPAYSSYQVQLGEIASYPPGFKENAGIFCHNNPWIMIAEAILGRGDKAFDYYRKIAPAFREELSELHQMEPYVYSQMIAGKDSKRHGQAKNSWLTGTASWNFVAISQWILGIQPEFNGLRIDPCIPKEWDGFSITRKFRGAIYQIRVSNPDHVCKGIRKITVDGAALEGNCIPPMKEGTEHKVDVEIGAPLYPSLRSGYLPLSKGEMPKAVGVKGKS